MKYLNIGVLLGSLFVLNACIEVEDENTADSLKEQNQILSEQLEQDNANSAPVTLHGTVINLKTDAPITEGKATLTVGDTVRESVTIIEGRFEISKVPANSDYELFIESTSNQFMARAFYGVTRSTSSSFVFQDLDFLYVSPEETLSFSVKDAKTEESIDNLVFKGSSHVGYSSRSIIRDHRSTYNAENQSYSISLPKLVSVNLEANLDIDKDQRADFEPSDMGWLSGTNLQISSNALKEIDEFSLIDLENPTFPKYEIRVSVVDTALNGVENLKVIVSDDVNGELEAVYDAETGQYVLDVFLKSELSILIPSFDQNEEVYQSSSITIYPINSIFGGEQEELQVSVSNSNNIDTYYTVSASSSVIDIAVLPRLSPLPDFSVDVVLTSSEISQDNPEFKVFYSSPVELLEDSVSLVKNDVLVVTRGNDSPDDSVSPGTTRLEWKDIAVPITTSLSLNDTLLKITPISTLPANFNYEYEVGVIKDIATGIEKDAGFEDAIQFSQFEGIFNINDLVLDNNNTTNGTVIVAQNTAGTTVPSYLAYDSDNSVYVYLPRAIESLESLSLTKVSVEEDTTFSNRDRTYNIVGDPYYGLDASSIYTVSLANNESILGGYSLVATGTSLEDGYYYRVHVGEYMSDHKATETNKITFEYSYETKGGDLETGTIELEVK